MSNDYSEVGVFLTDLLEKTRLTDQDLLLCEDQENTKKIIFRNFRISLIDDIESPSKYRIYSSQKIVDLIESATSNIGDGIGDLQEDVSIIKRDYALKKELNQSIKDIDLKKLDRTALENVTQELENTRKKSEPITGRDLAYGDEDEKIHLKHLGSDILDAMTGKTQVSIPSVPVGGWTGDDFANGSIGAIKLKKDYSYRGNYPEGNLNRLVESGVYEVSATVEGVPHYGDDMNETRLLEVIRYGKDGKYIIQRIYYKEYVEETRPYFERKGLFAKLTTLEFVAHFELTSQNKVNSDILGNTYNNRGELKSGDLFDIEADGNYFCGPNVRNLPTQNTYMVNVRTFADHREYEAKRADINACITYFCHEYYDSAHMPQRTDWIDAVNDQRSKSKFNGEVVHIFGDGISYGLGSSDILETAFPAILTNKYGYRIFNHSLSGATAGNYGDDILEERSLLTQIDNVTGFTTYENQYAIIFIGAEDYRVGKPIQDDDQGRDASFKGALDLAVEKILTRSPGCKIMFISPIFRSSTEPGDGYDCDSNIVNSKHLSDFVEAMGEIAKKNHIPFLNLFDECMINRYNATRYLNTDGVYPSDNGHALIAEKIHDGM